MITSYKTKKYEENFNLDFHTRRMYNLFIAANSNGVDRVINLSTLKLSSIDNQIFGVAFLIQT